jgi:monolysocardiolipin acyltransferase
MTDTHPMNTDRVRAALGRWNPEPSLARRLGAPLVVGACRVLIQVLNRLDVQNRERFVEASHAGRPLITFSNHTSLFDDPWLVSTFSSIRWDETRWCATDALNFFDNALSARFFSFGRGVPIVRGMGVDQMGMHFLADRLKSGDWVHIFPEGSRSRTPGELSLPLKTGMGHLVKASRPLLLPFHHTGMETILPIGSSIPRMGKRVGLRFGEVFDSDTDLADRSVEEITDWATERLTELQAVAR